MIDAAEANEKRRRAALLGAGAVFLWGSLAVLTRFTGDVPAIGCGIRSGSLFLFEVARVD